MKKAFNTWKTMGDALQLGATIAFSVFIGAGIGYWLDRRLSTFPYLSIVFFLFGLAAAGRELWKTVKKQLQEDRENSADQ